MKYKATVQGTAHLPWDSEERLAIEIHTFSRDFQAGSLFKLIFLIEEFVTNFKCWDITMALTSEAGIENYSRASWMHSWANA